MYSHNDITFGEYNKINEPLTGRKWEYQLFPISWEEYENYHGFLHTEQNLENRLLYGFYPDVLNNVGDEVSILSIGINHCKFIFLFGLKYKYNWYKVTIWNCKLWY